MTAQHAVLEKSPQPSPSHPTHGDTDSPPTHISFTGRMLNFTRLQIQGNDLAQIKCQLQNKLAQSRATTQAKLHVLVSCRNELDLRALWQLLWQSGLQPIGVVTGIMDEQALEQNIPIFPAEGERLATLTTPPLPVVTTTPSSSPTPPAAPPMVKSNFDFDLSGEMPTSSQVQGDKVYNQIVRSGQSINHVGGDLILTSGINAGGEAITDYSLHVYGKAEGRLVAGATGDSNARIFCLRFNPSLVSVAGTYCLRENIPVEFLDKAVQVSYKTDIGLIFQLMSQ